MGNALNSIDKRLEGSREQLETVKAQLKEARAEVLKPFPREKELADKLARLAVLNAELNIDGGETSVENVGDKKPSVLGEISELKKQAKEEKDIRKDPEKGDNDRSDDRLAI